MPEQRPWRPGDPPPVGYFRGRPFPVNPPEATPLRPLAKGSVYSGISEGLGFASWFGNLPGWTDRMDKAGSNALRVPERSQGISLSNPATLGQFFYVSDPNSGLTSVERQTDKGPGVRTQKIVDVSAAMAERLGYTRKTFPTGRGLWTIRNTGFSDSPSWAGRGGAFDEGGLGSSFEQFRGASADGSSTLTRNLAHADAISGSASVDIDIGSVQNAQDASVDDKLFRPLIIQSTAQMASAGSDRAPPSNFNRA
jgi:hypothetical protein